MPVRVYVLVSTSIGRCGRGGIISVETSHEGFLKSIGHLSDVAVLSEVPLYSIWALLSMVPHMSRKISEKSAVQALLSVVLKIIRFFCKRDL